MTKKKKKIILPPILDPTRKCPGHKVGDFHRDEVGVSTEQTRPQELVLNIPSNEGAGVQRF